jgi:HEAT repeat protein
LTALAPSGAHERRPRAIFLPTECGVDRRIVRIAWLTLLALVLAGCEDKPDIDYKELLDEDPQVRADAAMRLGQARAREAVDSLIAVIDDPDEFVRISVVQALGEIGDPKAIPALTDSAEDPLKSVRQATCIALGQIGDPAGIPALTKVLYDPDDRTRMIATRNLGLIEGPESLEVLMELALRDENEMVRQHVIKVIVRRGARDAIPTLERAMIGEADIVRANAARALGEIGDRSSVPTLLRGLEDPFFKVRSLSAHALWELAPDDPEVEAAIKRRLEMERQQMARVDLAWNLARMGDPEGLEVLRLFLFRGDPEDVRAEAAMALGEVGDESDIERLKRAANDKKGLVRQQAVIAIEKLEEGVKPK